MKVKLGDTCTLYDLTTGVGVGIAVGVMTSSIVVIVMNLEMPTSKRYIQQLHVYTTN